MTGATGAVLELGEIGVALDLREAIAENGVARVCGMITTNEADPDDETTAVHGQGEMTGIAPSPGPGPIGEIAARTGEHGASPDQNGTGHARGLEKFARLLIATTQGTGPEALRAGEVVSDPVTGIGTGNVAGTEIETANASDAAAQDPDPAQQHDRLWLWTETMSTSGNRRRSRSGKGKPRPTSPRRKRPRRKASPFPVSKTGETQLVVSKPSLNCCNM